MVFRASWLGIPAADARVILRADSRNSSVMSGEVWVRTNKLVDLLFKMRDYVREDFNRYPLAPRDMYVAQHENRRHIEYRVNFDRSTGLVTMVKRGKRGTDVHRFRSDNPWGLISGAVMALSQPLAVGRTFVYDVFTASSRYVISFRVVRRERLSTPLGETDALRIVPTMVYSSDDSVRKKARDVAIWVSADERHLPLRIEAAAFIGTVRADLIQVSYGAAPAGASGETPPPTPLRPQ